MKRLLQVLLLLAALTAYLLAWPTDVDPQVWTPSPDPGLTGVYEYNEKLKDIQKLLPGAGVGPEGVNVDAVGRAYGGFNDGRIITVAANASSYTVLGNTLGRPLGISFGPRGGLVIADAKKGLLHLGQNVTVLATESDGIPFGFVDDVDNTVMTREVFFSDASSKFGYGEHIADALEHGAHGRLLRYDFDTRKTTTLLKDLYFANGVAVGPDDAYVLVNETTEYRVRRYWLKGDKAGTSDVFIEGLPGFPDNISFNGRDKFWLALYAPRDKLLDQLADKPFLRKVVSRLPSWLQPSPKKHSFVLGLDLEGKVIANLQYAGSDAYAPITSVREFGPWLYFGSLSYPGLGRLPLNTVVPGATPPPSGWDKPLDTKEIPLPKPR